LILNGGFRYDDYSINTSGYGTVGGKSTFGRQSAEFGIPDFNLGLTLKPAPNGSVYVAYATSANPVGAEFDGTSSAYGGLAPVLANSPNQIFGPEKNKAIELGTKWELFDRHPAADGSAVPDQQGERPRSLQRHRHRDADGLLSLSGRDGFLHHRRFGLLRSRHRSRRGRQDHRQMERVRRPGADAVAGDAVECARRGHAGAVVVPDKCRAGRLPMWRINPSACLTKYQLNDTWELGGQGVYRSKIYGGTLLAANQGTSIPGYWRFDAFAEARINQNWKVKLFVNNIFDKRYYDAPVPERGAVRAGGPRPCRLSGAVGEGTDPADADLHPRSAGQVGCGGFPPHHG